MPIAASGHTVRIDILVVPAAAVACSPAAGPANPAQAEPHRSPAAPRVAARGPRPPSLGAMDVVVSGSSGLIGTALVEALPAAGHRPIRLVRRAATGDEIRWDPDAGTIDSASLEGVGAVVHLAGAGIGDHRWTDEYKLEILRSRTIGTVLLAGALAELTTPPSVLVSGSAIGYYGDRGDEVLDETSTVGIGFLAEVCTAWERATVAAEEAGIRVAHIRTGIVLSAEGGALKKQLPLFKVGAGGKLGRGTQWQSWISIDDEVGAIIHLLGRGSTHPDPPAPTRPAPARTAQPAPNQPAPSTSPRRTRSPTPSFAKTLARVLGRPSFLPIPSFGPKLVLGSELADSLLFSGQRVLPRVLEESGYAFRHPTLEVALRAVLGQAWRGMTGNGDAPTGARDDARRGGAGRAGDPCRRGDHLRRPGRPSQHPEIDGSGSVSGHLGRTAGAAGARLPLRHEHEGRGAVRHPQRGGRVRGGSAHRLAALRPPRVALHAGARARSGPG